MKKDSSCLFSRSFSGPLRVGSEESRARFTYDSLLECEKDLPSPAFISFPLFLQRLKEDPVGEWSAEDRCAPPFS